MKIQIVYLLAILFCVPAIQSCSVTGSLIGSAVDKSKPNITVDGWQETKIKNGATLKILFDDGRVIEGQYRKRPKKVRAKEAIETISLENKDELIKIPVNQIKQVSIVDQSAGKVGFLLGIIIDLVAVAVLVGAYALGVGGLGPL